MIKFPYVLTALTTCALLSAGCGKPSANLIPAVGTVSIDGKPADAIMVQFLPKTLDPNAIAPSSQAITDEAGNFELRTTDNNVVGAVAGRHTVRLYDTLEERVPQGKTRTKPLRLDPSFSSGSMVVEVVEGEAIEIEAHGPR